MCVLSPVGRNKKREADCYWAFELVSCHVYCFITHIHSIDEPRALGHAAHIAQYRYKTALTSALRQLRGTHLLFRT